MKRTLRTAALTAALSLALSGTVGCGQAPEPTAAAPATQQAIQPVAPPTAQVPVRVGRPTRVEIPAIGVDERLHGVGLDADGEMEMPDFGDAAWYDLGPRPGAVGPAVIVAHVHGPDGDDVFADLDNLDRGDRVTVRRKGGSSTFVVDSVESAKKESLPHERIWGDTTSPVLRLITCGGTPNPTTRVYPDNTIVYAHLAS